MHERAHTISARFEDFEILPCAILYVGVRPSLVFTRSPLLQAVATIMLGEVVSINEALLEQYDGNGGARC